MRPLARVVIRVAQAALIVLGIVGLGASAWWLRLEDGWTAAQNLSPAEAFQHGTLGLEFAPLKYVLVMDKVSAKTMTRNDGRDWQTSFGFLPNPAAASGKACAANAADYLPVGFSVSHLLPGSAAGSPVQFVGLTCAACHSSQVHMPDNTYGPVTYGTGNTRIDLIAWTDAFRNTLLDPTLDADKILAAYDSLGCDDREGWLHRKLERFIISSWLDGVRVQMSSDNAKYDLPYSGAELSDSVDLPAGPLRTRPFRSIVRNGLDLPGEGNLALSKIPAVFEQGMKPRSQFDGSIGNHIVRSMVAAFASGSSIEALSKPIVYQNIRNAADYTLRLGEDDYGRFGYGEHFTGPQYAVDATAAERGAAVYREYCQSCHGTRAAGSGAWTLDGADKVGKRSLVQPDDGSTPIGTDPARVGFRYTDIIPDALYLRLPGSPGGGSDTMPALQDQEDRVAALIKTANDAGRGSEASFWTGLQAKLEHARRLYPAGHPLSFKAGVLEAIPGYLNSPIPYAWLRAPYLHNGSVPTLAGLINLKQRPAAFCRGDNVYDPADVGIAAPEVADAAACTGTTPFFFDTRLAGNRNTGHDFPWAWDSPARDEAELRDLLEYLKTL